MAINNIFKTTNIKARPRQIFSVSNFNGVDYNSNLVNLSDNRAMDMRNIIKRNGINQKRFGWISRTAEKKNKPILNIWEVPDSVRVSYTHHFVAYDGNDFYEVSNFDDESKLLEFKKLTTDLPAEQIKSDKPLYGFATQKALFVLTGNRFIRINFKGARYRIDPVDNLGYIPTVELNIRVKQVGYNPSVVEKKIPAGDLGVDTIRTPFDDYNLLSQYVKVKGIIHTLPQKYYDGIASGEFNAPNWYMYVMGTKFVNPTSEMYPNIILEYKGQEYELQNVYIDDKKFDYSLEQDETHTRLAPAFVIDESKFVEYGATRYNSSADLVTALRFSFDTNSIQGNDFQLQTCIREDNLEADAINKCKFGIVYKNRLFISGNEENPNEDWHSSGEDFDFTYFSDLDYAIYGSNLSSVKGYITLNDGSLAVLKEPTSRESTIYFRTQRLVDATDYSGGVVADPNGNRLKENVFPLVEGSNGEGVINTSSLRSFSQDKVFLSPNGLFGITLNGVNSQIKYSRERSKLINEQLTKHNLSNAVIGLFDNKYFISIDGVTYVADAKYLCQFPDDLSDYQYEWWVWENVNATCFFNYNGKFYFGTDNGSIREFKDKDSKNKYIDTRISEPLSIALGNEQLFGTITGGEDYLSYKETKQVTFTEGDVYCEVMDTTKLAQFNIIQGEFIEYNFDRPGEISYVYSYVNYEKLTKTEFMENTYLSNGSIVYFDQIVFEEGFEPKPTSPKEGKSYTIVRDIIEELTDYSNRFALFSNEDGYQTSANLQGVKSFRLNYKVPHRGNIVLDKEDKQKFYLLDEYGVSLPFSTYANVTGSVKGTFYNMRNIPAYYVTKPYFFGTTAYLKNIYSYTLTSNVTEDITINLGINFQDTGITLLDAYKNNYMMDFENLRFNRFAFSKDMPTRSMVVAYKVRDINTMQFVFKNENDDNISVNNLSVLYTIGFQNRGEQ